LFDGGYNLRQKTRR